MTDHESSTTPPRKARPVVPPDSNLQNAGDSLDRAFALLDARVGETGEVEPSPEWIAAASHLAQAEAALTRTGQWDAQEIDGKMLDILYRMKLPFDEPGKGCHHNH